MTKDIKSDLIQFKSRHKQMPGIGFDSMTESRETCNSESKFGLTLSPTKACFDGFYRTEGRNGITGLAPMAKPSMSGRGNKSHVTN